MELAERIAQFENMAQADPDNEMAHFSLGGAYAQAERHAAAASSYEKCTRANPDMSKAYQLAAEQYLKAKDPDRALSMLDRGYPIAARLGDLMPKNAMAKLYERLDRKPPVVKDAAPEPVHAAGTFVCTKTGRAGTKLPRAPFKGAIGNWIHDNISQQTWNDWIAQGTKVINELRLDLSRDEDAQTYDRYMHEYLGLDEQAMADLVEGDDDDR